MKLPEKSKNIYPRNKANIEAILKYYFDMPIGDVDWLLQDETLSTNQIEFIAKQVSTHLNYLQLLINATTKSGESASNYMKYGCDALVYSERKWQGSSNRNRITKEFKNHLQSLQL